MSALDIIEQIKALSPSERDEVKAWMNEHLGREPAEPKVKTVSHEMFQRAEDHLFEHYGPLLEKLAQ